jgi:trehalose 6-phosphate phosphatase
MVALTGDPSGDLAAPAVPDLRRTALLCDLDGTLTPLAPTPGDIGPDPKRRRLLERLSAALGGRLAIVSGRALDDIDRILEDQVAAVAGVHGLVRRTAAGDILTAAPAPGLEAARQALKAFAAVRPGLAVEDKTLAIALHYRADPHLGDAAQQAARRAADAYDLCLQLGDHVVELRPAGAHKGDAVAAFMREPPFAGATPLYIGDDLTDEHAFHAAQALGGHGVVVGPRRPTAAAFALQDVPAVVTWLQEALDRL